MGGTTNSYHLGIDLGTTYTAAAVHRGGHTQMATLGNRAAAAPSVLLLRDDGQFLYGEAAEHRGESEPHRLAREFKRRLGDPVPLIVDRTPFAADALMAKMLRWVVDTVTRTEGESPTGIAVTHPANWGDYKRDLLRQALRVNDLDHATLLTEPEAAAIHYATEERLADGATVAVYDLGGGTFDAAVLRRSGADWQLLGQPEGVERLGGIDVDAAVFAHVVQTLGITVDRTDAAGGADTSDDSDRDDTSRQAALHRLRRDCVAAKEVLSEDTDTSVPVLLPDLQTQVRLTRTELETMIRPALAESVTALNTALRSAQIKAGDVDAVLLVGGSSRIPLVGELVSSALGRPVVVNSHPKHSIALGAATVAAGEAGAGAEAVAEPADTGDGDRGDPSSGLAAAGAGAGAGGAAGAALGSGVEGAAPDEPTGAGPMQPAAHGDVGSTTTEPTGTTTEPPTAALPASESYTPGYDGPAGYGTPGYDGTAGYGTPAPAAPGAQAPGFLARVLIGAGLGVVLGVVGVAALIGNPFDDEDNNNGETATVGGTAASVTTTAEPDTIGEGTATTPPTTSPPETSPSTTEQATAGSEPPLSAVPTPPADLTPTATRHEVVEAGSGPDPLQPGDELTFQFVGRLADGTVFVNSWETSGEVTVTLDDGTLIGGFEEALYGLVAGDRAEVYIGSEAGYGPEGNSNGSVPPDSDMAYLVDIIAVNGERP